MSSIIQGSVPVWVVSLLITIILALGGYLYADSRQELGRLEAAQIRYWDRVDLRVSALEILVNLDSQRIRSLETSLPLLDSRLNRIEQKLDLLLSK